MGKKKKIHKLLLRKWENAINCKRKHQMALCGVLALEKLRKTDQRLYICVCVCVCVYVYIYIVSFNRSIRKN
jgi:hypothetical protein